mmetsp:Transcript_2960/g.6143  ORF Transcript_2960/g.6143 Transcript_2960/m.6143 type:complete len:83 (+) Transcript_2960:596-844(+)
MPTSANILEASSEEVVLEVSEKATARTIRAISIKAHPIFSKVLRPFFSTNTTDTDVANTLNNASNMDALDPKPGTFARMGVA